MSKRLNIGCGFNKMPGYINVDKAPSCEPDLVVDLETRWPFENDSISEVQAHHVMEHLGQETTVFLNLMKELYRVCADGAKIYICVPHHEHWTFHADPTHVRKILPEGLQLFDQDYNRECIRSGAANTPLGLYCSVDFVLEKAEPRFDEPWSSRIQNDLVSRHDLQFASRHYQNVIVEWHIVLRVRKPSANQRQ